MTGHGIFWTVEDRYPDTYTIYKNSVLVDSGSLTNGTIVWNVDGLAVGSYNFTLAVNDTSNNKASDTVWVTVMPSLTPVTITITKTIWDTITETVTEPPTTVTTTVTTHPTAILPELKLSLCALGLIAVLSLMALIALGMRRKRRR